VIPEHHAITPTNSNPHISRKESHIENQHPVNPDIKVHSVVSSELDFDHDAAMLIPLGETSDEQLLAEVARRHIDLHDKITDSLVKETYEIGKVLGHGASGKVYQVVHKGTGQSFACKVVKKNSSMNDAQSMSTEIEIMKRIRHRNIVSMYELYETPKCLWIILELVDGGDLHHYLAHTVHYNEVMASKQFRQILAGCHYLHSLGVVHRDLKLDNILLNVRLLALIATCVRMCFVFDCHIHTALGSVQQSLMVCVVPAAQHTNTPISTPHHYTSHRAAARRRT